MSMKLPAGWEILPLSELADSCLGKMLDRQKHTTGTRRPYLRNQNVRWQAFDCSDLSEMFFEDHEHERYGLHPGDVLICEGGEPGRAAVWDGSIPDMKFQKAIHRVRPNPALLPDWLVHQLRFQAVQGDLEQYFTGTTIKHFTGTSLTRYPVILPPVAEQSRILAKLQILQSKAGRVARALDEVPALIEKLRQSILAAAFRGDLTKDWRAKNPNVEPAEKLLQRIREERRCKLLEAKQSKITGGRKSPTYSRSKEAEADEVDFRGLPTLPFGWVWSTVEELASDEPRSIQSGPFGSNLLHSEFRQEGILAIGIDNVQDGFFTLGSSHRISKEKFRELEKYSARGGDVLITVMATVGRCCLVPEDLEPAIITKHVYRISPDRRLVVPEYLMQSIRGAPALREAMTADLRGQTRPGINGGILRTLPVPVAPLAEQQVAMKMVNRVLQVLTGFKDSLDEAVAELSTLDKAILSKAFRGALVPQDPSDEPAAALLARLRSSAVAPDSTTSHPPQKNTPPKKPRGRPRST